MADKERSRRKEYTLWAVSLSLAILSTSLQQKKILKGPNKLGLNFCLVSRKQLIQAVARSGIIQIQRYLLLTHSAQQLPFQEFL